MLHSRRAALLFDDGGKPLSVPPNKPDARCRTRWRASMPSGTVRRGGSRTDVEFRGGAGISFGMRLHQQPLPFGENGGEPVKERGDHPACTSAVRKAGETLDWIGGGAPTLPFRVKNLIGKCSPVSFDCRCEWHLYERERRASIRGILGQELPIG